MSRLAVRHPAHAHRVYGWKHSLPDHRDIHYACAAHLHGVPLPPGIDLRPGLPSAYDQGQLGSCTGNAIAGAIEFDLRKQKAPKIFTPSRLMIYWLERRLEGTLYEDAGAEIRDGMKVCAQFGVCPESEWPYIESRYTRKPGPQCFADALHDKVLEYRKVPQDLVTMKACLVEGYPIVIGFTVFSGLESDAVAESGMLPMPGAHESSLGGHAVLVVGYRDSDQHWIVRNSWGPDWGDHGHFYMPYAYLTSPKYASDFWTARRVG